MKKVLIAITDEQAKKLADYPNVSETIRNALDVYIEHISTPDTIAGLRVSYEKLQGFMETKFEYYDKVFGDLEKLINMLETRM